MRIHCPGCEVKLKVAADDADTKIDCPKCGERFRPSEADEVDDRPARRGRDREEGEKKAFPVVPVAIAGGAALMLIVTVVVVMVVVLGGDKKKDEPVANAPAGKTGPLSTPPLAAGTGNENRAGGDKPLLTPPPGATPPNPFNGGPPDAAYTGPNPDPGRGGPPAPPAPPAAKPPHIKALDDLFQLPVGVQPPKVKAAVLDKDNAAPLTVPTFFSLRKGQQKPTAQPPKNAKLTLDEIKAATVYIKVDAGDMSGSGSGFFIGVDPSGKSALVATNHHVIEHALRRRLGTDDVSESRAKKPVITCVFNSGVAGQEWSSVAKVTAMDPIADLAVLRLETPRKMPKPIDPRLAPRPTETMEVRICGFPFGGLLATGSDNPNINIGNGTVSSLRLDKGGKLEQVQINGALNPGNSGGPIVDKDGRLVGIARATINPNLGSGLGFAVPVDELIAMLEGKLLLTEFVPQGIVGGKARFRVVVPIMDPSGQIGQVYLRYWAGQGAKPAAVKDPKIGHKPIATPEPQVNMGVADLPSALTVAAGTLDLPADATEVVLQIASETTLGLVAASAPVTFKLKQEEVETGADAKPMADLVTNYAALVGRPAVVKARLVGIETGGDGYKRLIVADANDRIPTGLRFVIDYNTAVQLDEIDLDDLLQDVRLTCVPGPQGPDGSATVRVARLDFLEDGGVITKTAPTADTKDPLFALNRDPAKHVGQKMTVKTDAVPLTKQTAGTDRLLVLFPSLRQPRNLEFVLAKGLFEKMVEAKVVKPNAVYRLRLAVTVEGTPAPGRPAKATVSKIEILDPRDESVLKVIE